MTDVFFNVLKREVAMGILFVCGALPRWIRWAGAAFWGCCLVAGVYAAAPGWWQRRGVVSTGGVPEDFGVLNQGQLKQMALAAFVELENTLSGGPGDALTGLLDQWTWVNEAGKRVPQNTSEEDDYVAVNLGQLKKTASLFYDRLVQEGLVRTRPWGWGDPDDFAAANVGQAKALFAFETNPRADINANGLPDLWEVSMFGYLGVNPDGDADGDGVSNMEEYLAHTDPCDFFNGHAPHVVLVSGGDQVGAPGAVLDAPLVMRVSDDSGAPMVNAPVCFEVVTGQDGGVSEISTQVPDDQRRLWVRTDSDGLARVRFRLPAEQGFSCLVNAKAGDSEAVVFRSRTQQIVGNENGLVAAKTHAPEFSLHGGDFPQKVEVRVTCGTPGAVVRFTLDGSDPAEKDPSISSDGLVELADSSVLKARAFLTGRMASDVKSAAFRIGPSIGSGSSWGLGLDEGCTVWSWGANERGQLGLGHSQDQGVPVPLQRLGDVVSAAAGGKHGLAVLHGGTVLAWGANENGQIGNEQRAGSSMPSLVQGLPAVRSVAAGAIHSVALGEDGFVWSWGGNGNGQLGSGTQEDAMHPLKVKGLRRVIAIAAGDAFTVALCSDGSVWAWGAGQYGQLGRGDLADSALPVRVQALGACVAIAAGGGHVLALGSDGVVWAWGRNESGQLGIGDTVNRSLPVVVGGGLEKVRSITAAHSQSMALLPEDVVMSWGWNEFRKNRGDAEGSSLTPALARTSGEGITPGDGTFVYCSPQKGAGKRGGASASGASGTAAGGGMGAVVGTRVSTPPASFELRMRHLSDWGAKPEVYRILVDVSSQSENAEDSVQSFGFREEITPVYSAFLREGTRDDGIVYEPLELREREDAGSYQGPPATSLEELAMRENVLATGSVELQVEVLPPLSSGEKRTFTFSSEYSHHAFMYHLDGFVNATGGSVDVEFGSTIRFKCPSISSRVIGGYQGDEKLYVILDSIFPDAAETEVNEAYMLFRQKEGGRVSEFMGVARGAVLSFSAAEMEEYVLCPVVLTQGNYPTSKGTTDMGTAEARAIANNTVDASTAWIRGAGEMADLEIRLGDGRVGGLTVDWALDVRTERPEREDLDDFHVPVSGTEKVVSLPSDQAWKISGLLSGRRRFAGGICNVTYTVKNPQGKALFPTGEFKFRIRGKNPRDEEVLTHIHNNPSHSRFAWAMVQHESRQSSKAGNRVYNQFNSGGPTRELPNFSGNAPKEDGWGIAQLDKPLGKRALSGEVYSWKMNLQMFQEELEQKQKTADRYVDALRGIYASQGVWEELPKSFVREGTVTPMSCLEAAVIQLYNGAAWLVEIANGKIIYDGPYTSDSHGGERFISCWKFNSQNPPGSRWEFKPNKNNYLFKVIQDEWEGHLWYQE